MDKWQSDLIADLNACSCKADPPRCPNAGQACFCPGYCLVNPNCPKHGYDVDKLVQT